ncbi:MAG: Gfo/Idh/MocA family protein [Candidatus Cyclobacteriaceae bacterium M3_2C_046]
MEKKINIGIIGGRFMGKAHTNAWHDVPQFFDLPFQVVLHTACSVDPAADIEFAQRLGWKHFTTSWQEVVAHPDIDVIDICTPNNVHMPIAVAAVQAGKHVICEKPMAMNAAEAKQMKLAAEKAGVVNMVAFNYRRVPALALAKKMIEEDKIGQIHHFNAVYYQDWLVDLDFPYVWRHDKSLAGSGAHGDMNAHTIDLARFLAGEITSVCGQETVFISQRKKEYGTMGTVTADDSMNFMARFSQGAIGNFMATRFATGRKNHLRLEIFGSKGSLGFNLERLNELEFYSRTDEASLQGFRTIIVTESSHPYLNRWWPPGHIIGWEHTFIHEMGDFLHAIANGQKVTPDFQDGFLCQQVLDTVSESAEKKCWIDIQEIKNKPENYEDN